MPLSASLLLLRSLSHADCPPPPHRMADCPRHQVINRAGEKISPLAVEHALLAACIGPEAPDEPTTTALGVALDTAPIKSPGTARRPAGELYGWVREVLAFAAPHEELGEAVGVALVCESGRTVTLAQIRRAAGSNGLLSRRWLPEMLLMLPSLPRGPTGKPLRIGLAERFQLPSLRTGAPMLTLDMRVKQPLEHEAARRAEARKAHAFDAARRAEARKAAVRRPRQRSAAAEEGEEAEEAEDAVEAEATEGKAAAAAAAATTTSIPSAGAPISGRSGRGAVVGARSPGWSFAECQQLVIGAMLEASGEAVRGFLSAC